MPVQVGDVINGKYLIESFLGEGGVGVVAAARNIELDERVALKFLRPEMLGQAEIVARFMREAKAACSIKSEYVANVYDVGSMPDGAPYLVMEHLEGKDLGSVVEERGHLGYREATEYLMQTCEALAVAHSKGVIHRDIKPENLFLTSRAGMSVIKVLDFGISKAALTGSIFGNALPLVKTVNLMGTPLYMSPEQIRSAEGGDMRSDIWSLGMVLFELLTGTLPFAAPTITELCAAILEAPMASVTTYRNDLPAGYVDVLEKCIERDPAKRFQNVAEMAVAFMPFAPKRARICAERATQALRAAGLIEESSVRFLSSMPPPSDDVSATHPSIPRLDGTGSNPSYPSATGSVPAIPRTPGVPTGLGSGAPANEAVQVAEPAPASRAKLILAFAVIAILAAGGAAAMMRGGDRTPAAAAATKQDPKPVTATEPAPPAKTTTAATPVTPASEPAVAATTQANNPTTGAGGPKKGAAWQWPAAKGGAPAPKVTTTPTVAASPAPVAAPTTPKKSAEEPDLGY